MWFENASDEIVGMQVAYFLISLFCFGLMLKLLKMNVSSEIRIRKFDPADFFLNFSWILNIMCLAFALQLFVNIFTLDEIMSYSQPFPPGVEGKILATLFVFVVGTIIRIKTKNKEIYYDDSMRKECKKRLSPINFLKYIYNKFMRVDNEVKIISFIVFAVFTWGMPTLPVAFFGVIWLFNYFAPNAD